MRTAQTPDERKINGLAMGFIEMDSTGRAILKFADHETIVDQI